MRNSLFWCLLILALPCGLLAQQPAFVEAYPLPNVEVDGAEAKVHTQGLQVTSRDWLVTGRLETNPKRPLLFRFSRTDPNEYEVADLSVASDANISLDHPGGFDRDENGLLWIPVSVSNRRGPSVILGIAIKEDRPLSEMSIVHSIYFEDHVGAVCCVGQGTLLAANWDTKTVYRFETAARDVRNKKAKDVSAAISGFAVQDWKYDAVSKRVLAGGIDKSPTRNPDESEAVITWIDLATGASKKLRLESRSDVTRPLTNEGLDWFEGELYLLPEDLGRGAKILRFKIE